MKLKLKLYLHLFLIKCLHSFNEIDSLNAEKTNILFVSFLYKKIPIINMLNL